MKIIPFTGIALLGSVVQGAVITNEPRGLLRASSQGRKRELQPNPPAPPEIPGFPDGGDGDGDGGTEPTDLAVPELDTFDGDFCTLNFVLAVDDTVQELSCTCDTTADTIEFDCDSPEPECNALAAFGVEQICYDSSVSVSMSHDWLAWITTFAFNVCADYAYPESVPEFLEGDEFCFDYIVTWDWLNSELGIESCDATITDETSEVEHCLCSVCQTEDDQQGFALACPYTTELSFLPECQPILYPTTVSIPHMEVGVDGVVGPATTATTTFSPSTIGPSNDTTFLPSTIEPSNDTTFSPSTIEPSDGGISITVNRGGT